MSKDIEAEVWSHAPVSGGALLVLLALADNADTTSRMAWPGVPSLARRARLSKRQTIRCIETLKEAGLLSVRRNASPLKTNLYCISRVSEWEQIEAGNDKMSPPDAASRCDAGVTTDVTPVSPLKCHIGTSDVTSATARCDTHVTFDVTPMSPKPSGEPSVRTKDSDESLSELDFGTEPEPPGREARDATAIYNAAAEKTGWPKAQKLTPNRSRMIRARLGDCGGLEGWRIAIDKALASDFLSGRTRKPWTGFGLDWVIKSQNFTKLMEGNYDNRCRGEQSAQRSQNRPDAALEQIARLAGIEPSSGDGGG